MTVVNSEISTNEDLYPSRRDDRATMLPRVDPVVYAPESEWGKAGISADYLRQYDQKGYMLLPEFFSPAEVAVWTAELNRLADDAAIKQRAEAIVEPTSNDLRSLFAVDEISAVFKNVAQHPRLQAIIQQILGSQAYIHQSRVNLKPGFVGKEFYWHSDFETWHVEDGMPRMRAVSCSILLTDNYVHNGPLMLVPGSHRKFVSCVGRTPDAHFKQSLKRQEFGVPDHASMAALADEFGIDTPTGKAGSVLFFDCNTMHGSAGNISPYPRSNLFFVYNSVENRLVDPYCGLAPRPRYIATRD